MALELMVQASIEAQDWMLNEHLHLEKNSLSVLRELCTVKVCGPRRCGHTTSMIGVAYQYFENPVFVVETLSMADHIEKIILQEHPSEKLFKIVSVATMDRNLRYTDFDALFVDVAALLSKTKEEQLYDLAIPLAERCFAKHKPFCVVMME
jgi:hypothetical protein